jgi:hypothetical protein
MALLLCGATIGCGPSSEVQTATAVAQSTATATFTSTSTVTPTSTTAPTEEYLPSPRWMMLSQPYYSVEILGEDWAYVIDNWSDQHACIQYRQEESHRWFEQCFAFLTAFSYDEVLDPFLDMGFEHLVATSTFGDVGRIDLVARRDLDDPKEIRFFQQVGTDEFLMLVEMTVAEEEQLPLQSIYEALAADVMDYVFRDMLTESRSIPRPTATPFPPGAGVVYDNLVDNLVTEQDLGGEYWEAIEDIVYPNGVCRFFELRISADVTWVNLLNCVSVQDPAYDIRTMLGDEEVLLTSTYEYEGDSMVFGQMAGHAFFYGVVFQDGYRYLASLESRVPWGAPLESLYNQDIDDFLNMVLLANLDAMSSD